MAGIDYSTLPMNKNGKICKSLKVGSYRVTGYKNTICFTKDKQEHWLYEMADAVEAFGEKNVKEYSLDGGVYEKRIRNHNTERFERIFRKYDIVNRKTGKVVPIKKFVNSKDELVRDAFLSPSLIYKNNSYSEHTLIIAHVDDVVMFYFPFSPEEGGATYAYFLYPDDSIAFIATGYGHNDNPMLHWMDRGLGEEIEKKMAAIFYEHMVSRFTFDQLMIEFNFWYQENGFVYEIAGKPVNDKDINRMRAVLVDRDKRYTRRRLD